MPTLQTAPTSAIDARIERMPFTAWHARLIGALGAAHFFDALDATALGFVLPVLVGLWHLTPGQAGILISASYVGQFGGAVLAGYMAERVGRLKTLTFSLIFMAAASLACAFAPAYTILLVLRVLQGVGLGAETPVAATYLNEVAPARFRGRMVTAIQLLFGFGSVASAIFALLLIPNFGWRSMFVLGSAPLIVAALLRLMLPESPRWLLVRGRPREADAAVARIESAVYGAGAVPKHEVLAAYEVAEAPAGAGITALLQPSLLKGTLSAWVIAFCSSIVGYGIIGWMPTIYRTVYHLPYQLALRYSILTGLSSLAGAFVCLFLIDRLGRKKSITLGFAGAALCMGAITLAGASISAEWVVVLASAALALLSLPLAGIYVYTPELYPTAIRALGMGVASSWLRIASIVGPAIIGLLLTIGVVGDVYTFLAITAGVGAVGTYVLGVETKTAALRPAKPAQ